MIDEKPKLHKRILWKIENFFENWIYPGYFLKNYLFYRHDLIKLPNVKPYEYIDVMYKIELANFELLRKFMEEENPEKYICWYKDENGEDCGHKYGEGDRKILFPELKGKYVMDLLKECYNFYFKELPILKNDHDYLLKIWSNYVFNGSWEECKDNKELYEWIPKKTEWNLEKIEKQNIKWDIIKKYIKKEDIFKENKLHEEVHKLNFMIEERKKFYLHLIIELREYLWT